ERDISQAGGDRAWLAKRDSMHRTIGKLASGEAIGHRDLASIFRSDGIRGCYSTRDSTRRSIRCDERRVPRRGNRTVISRRETGVRHSLASAWSERLATSGDLARYSMRTDQPVVWRT